MDVVQQAAKVAEEFSEEADRLAGRVYLADKRAAEAHKAIAGMGKALTDGYPADGPKTYGQPGRDTTETIVRALAGAVTQYFDNQERAAIARTEYRTLTGRDF